MKTQPQKIYTPIAYGDRFEAAVNFFMRSMRSRNFVEADELLLEKYGDEMHSRVTSWCFRNYVTAHFDGVLKLTKKYRSPVCQIKIER